ncbi:MULTISPECIES: fused MFS/spermidine synthase [Streptomyces]|uniref:fused MFS/spermidine synthase n=1 Tax=Streptomyces TaxID=1883 RepID=UPI0010397C24|nr:MULTISPECIES: fused MFS/spermidine synthase [Streptomyces]MBT3077771.1 fused MFS/spermidine synthase [Streptomyces sp. COG21]MBT3084614.1 fused MFS/spermidine synthase [Streptomyces sp. COG20]MBT3088746.1 fused MFS/spermidine synthase [Streptomyces sp. CYG21]MBT3095481.1 fused MFS/spermidine synthase [Streptomyces sp. CBG30]MBT3103438.1 fused MFS/spermidine synthase [Streptomyces sp. COG19]
MTTPSSPPVADDSPAPDGPPRDRGMGQRAAAVLVFGSSAAVLVVEIVALRLLAPYLGLTLETSTLVIGIALTAIALGSWLGGRVADRTDPHRLIAPALGVSGVVVALTPLLLRTTAEWAAPALLLVAAGTLLVPGALLSAVTPLVTKLRLTSLAETGTVVGRLSGVGTFGAIVGTVLTGFVLISRLPVSSILIGLGTLLVIGAVLTGWRARRWRRASAVALATVVVGSLATAFAPGGCDAETRYHCARIVADPERATGRTLVLDGLRHSYVDVEDPTYLRFGYVRAIAAVVDTAFPAGEPLAAHHIGGGGLTFPRYLAATRPGTRSLVSEIDGGVVRIDHERLNLGASTGIDVRVEDARLGLKRLEDGSRDLVVGDAFGGVSVPWHLTTSEALRDVRRVLKDDGLYAVNLIDHGRLEFARAEVATLARVFRYVAVIGAPVDIGLDPAAVPVGGNMVALAADRPFDAAAIQEALDTRETDWRIATGDTVTAWTGDAQVLTDDHAPVDQLLQPHRSPTVR